MSEFEGHPEASSAGPTPNQPDPTATPLNFIKPNRYGSFAGVRGGPNQVKWLIDGKDYMSAVADAIKKAKHEVFIADWQIHPYVHLKRPDTGVTSKEWQLLELLKERAEKDVKIYILLYDHPDPFLDLGASFAEDEFGKLPNVTFCQHSSSNPFKILWSHHEKLVVIDRSVAFVGGIDLCYGRWDTSAHALTDDPAKFWLGKDYCNTFLAEKKLDDHLDSISEDILIGDESIRTKIPRMPWHDVACMFNGEAASDVARHFIQRFNDNYEKPIISEKLDAICGFNIEDPSAVNADIQVVRSVADWSAGQPNEDSIHQAYLDAINNAEHIIYIENQFFISSQDDKVENKIQEALAGRIAWAYNNNHHDFRVVIFLPLLPEFRAEIDGDGVNSRLFAAICYWNYATLCNGEHSLWARLEKLGVPAEFRDRCVRVYGLRTHDVLNGKLVTELIYVHDKLMIVDDRKTIVGSANINDRSMLGDRDSEVDVVIEDREMIPGRMSGRPYEVGKFSHTLRCQLMKEHLGLLKGDDCSIDVSDPVCQEFHDKVSKRAKNNTHIYETVFEKLPTDQVLSKKDFKKWKSKEYGLAESDKPDNKEAKVLLQKVRGSIVNFPLLFLSDAPKILRPFWLGDITSIDKSAQDWTDWVLLEFLEKSVDKKHNILLYNL